MSVIKLAVLVPRRNAKDKENAKNALNTMQPKANFPIAKDLRALCSIF